MALFKPYYNLHQITTGLYARIDELVDNTFTDYEGLYHKLPNGQMFSGEFPSENSVELFVKKFDISSDVQTFNRVRQIQDSQYVSPVPYNPIPNSQQRLLGKMVRFFVQKRNNPLNSIVEIDVDQYYSINSVNRPGINEVIWNKGFVNWTISGDVNLVIQLNTNEIIKTQTTFIGLQSYLTNLLEFHL